MESLRSDLKEFFTSRLEEVLSPLKVEASTIKFWLARVANYLERVEPSSEDPHAADLVGLFGPCSPVHRSPTPSFFNSFAAVCMSTRDSMPDEKSVSIENRATRVLLDANGLEVTTTGDVGHSPSKDFGIPIANEMVLEHTTTPTLQVQAPEFQSTTTDTTTLPFHEPAEGISNLAVGTMPLATIPLECEKHEVVPLDLPVEQMSMQGGTSIEDVVVVEDASDDEETTSDVGTAIEDPIVLLLDADDCTQPTVEIKVEVPVQVHNISMDTTSMTDVTAMKFEELACTRTEPPSIVTPLATSTARRRCKHYDKSSVRRSVRLAQRKALKDLGIIANDGKLNEDAIQDCADILKELPPDLLKSLANLKSKDFWDVVAGFTLPPG